MNVLLLGPWPPPYGGVEVHLIAIRDFVRSAGDRCCVINLTRHRQADGDDVYFPDRPAGVISRILKLRPDVIHLHIGGDLSYRLLWLGALCAGLPGTHTLFTFHSGGYPDSEAGRLTTAGSLRARLLRRFERCIAVNEAIAVFFRKCGVETGRIRVISPYVLRSTGEGPLPPELSQFMAAHSPVLISVGGLEPEYDLPLQIEVMGRIGTAHPSAGLLIVGKGGLERETRQLIDSKPWRDRILLAGPVDHEITLAALRRSDLLLRTTLFDGDAISVRESIDLGVPVIATRTAFRPAGVRLVPIGDLDALEKEILDQIARPRKAPEGTASQGQQNLSAVYSLYQELLTKPE